MAVEASQCEYTPLRLLLIGKECTPCLSSKVSKHCLLESIVLRNRTLVDWDLHPAGSKNTCLSVIIGIATTFQRFSAVHGPWGESDPTLVLGNNCYHACLVDISELHLIPRVLHQTKIVRYLSLVSALLDGLLGEYLMRLLEVLMLIFGSVHDFFGDQLALLPLSGCYGSLPQWVLSPSLEQLWVDQVSSLDEVGIGGLAPGALYVLLLPDDSIVFNAIQGHV
jgi:hypothetical protein